MKKKKGLISKLINKILGDDIYEGSEFYIPDESTLLAIKNHQKLDDAQVIDYLNYISHNYYLSSSDEIYLSSFAAQWSVVSQDEDLINQYINKSTDRVAENLLNGNQPSVIDMLWISNQIYVNTHVEYNKRIITKQYLPTPRFDVKTGHQDFAVVYKVNQLKFELMSKLISKNLDNAK